VFQQSLSRRLSKEYVHASCFGVHGTETFDSLFGKRWKPINRIKAFVWTRVGVAVTFWSLHGGGEAVCVPFSSASFWMEFGNCRAYV